MSLGILSYPLNETDNDTITQTQQSMLHHKLPKIQSLSSSTVSSSTNPINLYPDPLTTLNDTTISRSFIPNIHNPADLSYSQFQYANSSSKTIENHMLDKAFNQRYYPINKHEFLPGYSSSMNLVSESVSPRSTSSLVDTTNSHYSNSYYQHRSLELPSPSSSTSSQTSKTAGGNAASTLFGSYSPSPFHLTIDSAARCALPSPTIFPPTPPPSAWRENAWNPFW